MRVKRSVAARKKHKKILKLTKGMSHIRTSSYRNANEAVLKALSYQYRDRRGLKRDMRSLWISRISASVGKHDLSYSEFIHKLSKANIKLNRKVLAELAVNQPKAMAEVIKAAK